MNLSPCFPRQAPSSGSAAGVLSRASAVGLALVLAACASAPPAKPAAAAVPYERKLAWILQLEDQRILEVPEPPPPPVDPAAKGRPPAPRPPVLLPNLPRLAGDPDARIRRRAALAIGRVGLKEGLGALTPLLADADADVRQAAAFGVGLIGDRLATPALLPLLQDVQPMVRGRAAEALGLVGAEDAVSAIAAVATEYGRSAAVSAMQPDDEPWPGAPEADAFKLALFALVRLRSYDSIAGVVLDSAGRPLSNWWPIAYALQRLGDPRAVPALLQLAQVKGRYTPAFALRGLGRSKDPKGAAVIASSLDPTRQPREVVASAIIAARDLGMATPGAALGALAADPKGDPTLRLEAVTTIGALKALDQLPIVQDLITDDWPAMRAAAIRAASALDPDNFTLILSGLEIDRHWLGRAALADAVAGLPLDTASPTLTSLLGDEDRRVIPSVLRALVRVGAADVDTVLLAHLRQDDYVIRETAASLLGQRKTPGGLQALRDAYVAAQPDATYSARAAMVSAMAAYGGGEAVEAIRPALADKDWAVRLRAAELLTKLDPASEHRLTIRPVPSGPVAPYDDPALAAPPTSPHVFIDTQKGTIEFELAVLDAPQTTRSFMALARKGFFNGLQVHRVVPNFVLQDGDPRGDGQGGPGYSIRDELNERPYLRGTVGMALAGEDTGGSQFFITHSPQPHLDAQYTVFGHVVNGMDVVDRVQVGDTITRIRIWDGKWLD